MLKLRLSLRRPPLLDDLLEFCFPGSCAACEAPCAGSSPLCIACLAELNVLASAPSCQLCGLPLAQHGTPCAYCKGAGVAHYERVIRLGVFEEPLRLMIHHLKYKRQWTMGEHLADCLLQQERVRGILSETQCLVPVPLHPWRRLTRGFNQAEIIARRLSQKCRIPLVRPAVRRRNTETQTHLHSHAQRMSNLKDAFELTKPKLIRDRNIVVIDDVMTTGATLQTLARALKPAKPASMCAIVVAVADPAGRSFEVA